MAIPLKDYPCNLCGGADLQQLYPATTLSGPKAGDFACTNPGHGEYYQIVRCQGCGLVFSSPRPAAGDIEEEYRQVEDPVYAQEIDGRFKTFSRNVRNLSRFIRPGRLLDIGAGMGVFVHMARQGQWDAQGIEPSLWCAKKSKELFGLDIRTGTFEQAKHVGADFDAVTMWDVIEHLDDPAAALQACHSLLKPGGILALSTVDLGSVYARLMGKRWPWLMRMHIYYFDRRTMRAYLEKSGFQVLRMSRYHHIISMRYLIYKLEAVGGLGRLLAGLLSKLGFLKNVYVTVALGDFMEVYARKLGDDQVTKG